MLFYYFVHVYRYILRIINCSRVLGVCDAYKVESYKDKYIGRRCFIIGNGPSLKDTDLSLLKNEFTFGLNRIYLNFNKMGYHTTFIVAINQLVIDQCKNEIYNLTLPVFLPNSHKKV